MVFCLDIPDLFYSLAVVTLDEVLDDGCRRGGRAARNVHGKRAVVKGRGESAASTAASNRGVAPRHTSEWIAGCPPEG